MRERERDVDRRKAQFIKQTKLPTIDVTQKHLSLIQKSPQSNAAKQWAIRSRNGKKIHFNSQDFW